MSGHLASAARSLAKKPAQLPGGHAPLASDLESGEPARDNPAPHGLGAAVECSETCRIESKGRSSKSIIVWGLLFAGSRVERTRWAAIDYLARHLACEQPDQCQSRGGHDIATRSRRRAIRFCLLCESLRHQSGLHRELLVHHLERP